MCDMTHLICARGRGNERTREKEGGGRERDEGGGLVLTRPVRDCGHVKAREVERACV